MLQFCYNIPIRVDKVDKSVNNHRITLSAFSVIHIFLVDNPLPNMFLQVL
jgi:hypothetical protein